LLNIISYGNKQLFHPKGKKNFAQFFDKSVFKRLSEKSGFSRRKARKITAYAFVLGFIECSLKRCCSYSQWAAAIGRLTGCSVSKQSLFERLGEGASAFAESLLQQGLKKQINKARDTRLYGRFKRVLLQDSTTLALPDILAEHFPGNISHGVQKAVARIQCIMEITAMRFLHFSLSGFTQNDQSASGLVNTYLSKNDLVIRDLGYFVLNSLKEITDKQAWFLSRLRYNVTIYDQQGKSLFLQKLLRKNQVDQWVCIGGKQRLPVRLVMVRLPAAQAAERIRKARKDRDKRLNHSKAYYQWLNYAVFITNVEKEVWTARQVGEAYKVRWQIEIVFKSWKSAFNLQHIVQERYSNVHRIRTAILLMLLFICLFIQKIYRYYKRAVEKTKGKTVSLLKLSRYVAANLILFFSMNRSKLQEQIARHCCYDKRSDRTNMTDLIQLFTN
jgi:hypothetical protein